VRRGDKAVEPGHVVPGAPPVDPLLGLDLPHPRRATRVHPAPLDRPLPNPTPQTATPPGSYRLSVAVKQNPAR
jgi:hypothetical protein